MKFVSLNICGVPFISKDVKGRLDTINQRISKLNADIIALQETYLIRHLKILRGYFREYHCASFHHQYRFGGGLVTFSKAPILKSSFRRFSNQGPLFSPTISDRLLGKGFLCVETPDVYFINVHILADYRIDPAPVEKVALAQRSQIQELQRFISGADLDNKKAIFIGGDFNFPPASPLYQEMLNAGLRDATNSLSGEESWAFRRSVHRWTRLGMQFTQRREGKFDYLFYADRPENTVTVSSSRLYLMEQSDRSQASGIYLSDHKMLVVDLKIIPKTKPLL